MTVAAGSTVWRGCGGPRCQIGHRRPRCYGGGRRRNIGCISWRCTGGGGGGGGGTRIVTVGEAALFRTGPASAGRRAWVWAGEDGGRDHGAACGRRGGWGRASASAAGAAASALALCSWRFPHQGCCGMTAYRTWGACRGRASGLAPVEAAAAFAPSVAEQMAALWEVVASSTRVGGGRHHPCDRWPAGAVAGPRVSR